MKTFFLHRSRRLILAVSLALTACSPLLRMTSATTDTVHADPAVPQAPAGQKEAEPVTKSTQAASSVTLLEQVSPAIEAGQYSAITWLGGNRYAVVHDKLNGGGIVFFDIDMQPATGAIGRVTVTIPDATRLSGTTGMDNEGIAYANGKIFVSAEYDQSIREYELDGTPTGRLLSIPEEFRRNRISGNAGFEALTFNAVTGLFWTTTEGPLKADKATPLLRRLQSFGADLQPAGQYLYQMDEPLKSAEGTRAYVHGISAMTALDDGRLVVLEREVYVPSSILRALTDTFSAVKLYVVHPGGKNGTLLPKTLLASFNTTMADLANYEGMCLGPTLTDGRHTLLLIADSQGGMSGLTNEYLKVIIF